MMNVDPATRKTVWSVGFGIALGGPVGGITGAMIGGGASGGASAALSNGNAGDIGRGIGIGVLTGVVSYGAGWFGNGLMNPDSGSYLTQIGKGGVVGAFKGAAVSLAVSLTDGKIDTRGMLRSAAIGAVLGAARPIAMGRDITDKQEMLGARIVAESIQGRDFSGVRFLEGGILQGLGLPHEAITLGGLVNFDDGRLAYSDWVRLVGHELGHVSQEQDLGLLRFQSNYLFGGAATQRDIESDADARSRSTCYSGLTC
jgi:hypothetical protein